MDSATFKRLLEDVKNDAQLFHALVFDPEKALSKLKYLQADHDASRPRIDPQAIVALTVGELSDVLSDDRAQFASDACGPQYTCSCTTGTCGGTCGGGTCDVTCSGESCAWTCAGSCGYTTHLAMVER